MDDNVPPYNTLLVVDALIKANKDFDLLLLPNEHHGYADESNYMMRAPLGLLCALLAGRRAATRIPDASAGDSGRLRAGILTQCKLDGRTMRVGASAAGRCPT